MTVYKCPVCDRTFRSIQGLAFHYRRSHAFSLRCPVCGREFRSNGVSTHVYMMARRGDVDHTIAYYLGYRKSGSWKPFTDLAVNLIEEKCKVECTKQPMRIKTKRRRLKAKYLEDLKVKPQ